MNFNDKEQLEIYGWEVGTLQEFLSLSIEEASEVENRIRLIQILNSYTPTCMDEITLTRQEFEIVKKFTHYTTKENDKFIEMD